MMLPQEQKIKTVRALCAADQRIVAAAMYGSFTRGEGDEFSDVEFYLFVDDEAHASFDLPNWIGKVAPVDECFQNEFGTTVALFSDLTRGEFHARPASSMSQVRGWKANVWVDNPSSMLILDRTGELKEHLAALVGCGPDRSEPKSIALLFRRFLDWMIFGTNVLRRGEHARALEILWFVHRHLLWMVRIMESKTQHFPTPSKSLEEDISPKAYRRYCACTATLSEESLRSAYGASWFWGRELMAALSATSGAKEPTTAMSKLAERMRRWKIEDGVPNKPNARDGR